MRLEEAQEIAQLLHDHFMFGAMQGVGEKPAKLRHSLAQLVEANEMVKANNGQRSEKWGKEVYPTFPDQTIAAIYCAAHFAPSPEKYIRPIIENDRGMLLFVQKTTF